MIGFQIIDSRRCEEGIECLELAERDVEVWIDENIGWADGAVGTAASMQPGNGRCQTVRPSNQGAATLFLGEAFEERRLIGQEAVQSAVCLGARKQHADLVVDKI